MDGKEIECGGFTFLANFDSANLARVELVPKKLVEPDLKPSKKSNADNSRQILQKKPKKIDFPDYEFNIWTNPDCSGTEFENSNRAWFYFGITGGTVFSLIKLNIIDLNKLSKMYSQGMAPVFKIVPGKCQWERIHDKPIFTSENNIFTLSFKYRTSENIKAITYFAFTYPFSYIDLQNYLGSIDMRMSKQDNHLPKPEIKFNKGLKISNDINDALYYHRETLCYSLQNRIIDLITISSHHNITAEREPRLKTLFPHEDTPRAFKFQDKKVVFISARVHPGETPSSFVMNGILNLLIQKDDPIAILLRRQFVFKLIPMLNPDGVALGHYRTDTRGCNLNRYYLNPSREFHPSIYGARALIRYHHFGEEVEDDYKQEKFDVSSQVDPNELSESEYSSPGLISPKQYESTPVNVNVRSNKAIGTEARNLEMLNAPESKKKSCDSVQNFMVAHNSVSSTDSSINTVSNKPSNESITEDFLAVTNSDNESTILKDLLLGKNDTGCFKIDSELMGRLSASKRNVTKSKTKHESGLFLYLDMHGHASKKGVFMYGNHFDKTEDSIECMLFPKIMSVNSQNFHFPACNFTEKNMYLRDKRDGTSREGSGRVAVLRLTGLVRSYTLECNYNTGRFVNKLPQCCRDLPGKNNTNLIVPPKYSPTVYEEIGRSICISILDLINSNPWSRIPNSEYHTLFGIRDWLRLKTISESFLYHRPLPRSLLRAKHPNKSSQTQVEDFIAFGYDYELEKKLKDIQREKPMFELGTLYEIKELEKLCDKNEDEGEDENENDYDEDNAENKNSEKDFFKEKGGTFRSFQNVNNQRLSGKRKRAAELLNPKDTFLSYFEHFESGIEKTDNVEEQNDESHDTRNVMMGVLRSEVRPGKLLSNVLLAPLHSKQPVIVETSSEEADKRENLGFRGNSCGGVNVNRKEAGPSHGKRTVNRVSTVLQVRGGGSRPLKSLKKTIYRTGDKFQKFKQFNLKSEGNPEEGTVELTETERKTKISAASDQCLFKQNPKRLKISKGDDASKTRGLEWSKEDAIPGPSSSDIVVYSKLSRPVTTGENHGKKRTVKKPKPQLSPIKFKKSLEKRRGSDSSRKKSKTLFKKAGKIILTNDINKNSIDRKRRKN